MSRDRLWRVEYYIRLVGNQLKCIPITGKGGERSSGSQPPQFSPPRNDPKTLPPDQIPSISSPHNQPPAPPSHECRLAQPSHESPHLHNRMGSLQCPHHTKFLKHHQMNLLQIFHRMSSLHYRHRMSSLPMNSLPILHLVHQRSVTSTRNATKHQSVNYQPISHIIVAKNYSIFTRIPWGFTQLQILRRLPQVCWVPTARRCAK